MKLSRNELTKALVKGLKLDDNIFNYQAVAEEIEHIRESQFMDFYKTVMATNTYGNGLQAIIKIAETYKSQVNEVDHIELKAKELIALVKGMNESVYQTHIKTGVRFEDLINKVMFPTVSDDDIAILNQVKPYCSHKLLISNINAYQTSIEQLHAFKWAVNQTEKQSLVIGLDVRKMIKG